MATSEVDICNDGLAYLGQSKFIQSLTEASQAGRLCNRFYPKMRDATLREFPWRFARREITLSELSATVQHWDYVYRYPTDCLFARGIMPTIRSGTVEIPFDVMADDKLHGRWIVTDEPDAVLAYTAQMVDPYSFDSLFADALAHRIAWALAMPLTKEPKLQEAMQVGFRWAIGQARVADAIEAQRDPRPESELIRTRE